MVSEMESVNKSVNTNNQNNAAANYNLATNNQNNNNNAAPPPTAAAAPPSAQNVALEFVRQYYTILNRAPNLLYRFYGEDSTLIHGSLDKPGEPIPYVHGQKQIDDKILSLNYQNCRTKIRQVDSMETIGNGVVIQVIGDLSNNGQPLRRFNQTFVLTPQSPNKYYVRNDIFRYQDQLEYEMVENDNSSMHEDAQVANSSNVEKEFVTSSYKANGNAEELASNVQQQPPPPTQTTSEKVAPLPPPTQQQQPNQSESTTENMNQQKFILQQEPSKTTSAVAAGGDLKQDHNDNETEVENTLVDDMPKASISPSVVNEPKTYAGILGRSSHQPSGGLPPSSKANYNQANNLVTEGGTYAAENPPLGGGGNTGAPPTVVGTVPKTQQPFAVANSNQQGTTGGVGGAPTQQQQRNEYRFAKKNFNRRNDSRESSGKNNNNNNNNNNDSDSGDGNEQQQQQHFTITNNSNVKKYPDENQLFIGNLLPNFNEDGLFNIFKKYGKILDIRLYKQKQQSGNKNRNYGFITFENPGVVEEIIAKKPIYHDNHRYNVEKKQGKSSNYDRPRGGGGSGSDRNIARNASMQQQQQSSSNNIQSAAGGLRQQHLSSVNVSGGGPGGLGANQPSASNLPGGGARSGNRMSSGGGSQNYNANSNSGPNNNINNNMSNTAGQQQQPNRNQVFNHQQQH